MEERARFLDPRGTNAIEIRRPAPRLTNLAGKTLCLLDISKSKGDIFLNRLEELLRRQVPLKTILRRRKPTFTRPAPKELFEEIVGSCDGVIEALAD